MLKLLDVDEVNAVRIFDYWFAMEFLNQQSLRKFRKLETKYLNIKKN